MDATVRENSHSGSACKDFSGKHEFVSREWREKLLDGSIHIPHSKDGSIHIVVKGNVIDHVTIVEDPAPVPWCPPWMEINLFHVAEPVVSENSVVASVG